MAADPVRFRCKYCNQLLGVARARIGKTANCPKCAAELTVPDDERPVPPPIEGAPTASISEVVRNKSEPTAEAEGIPLESLDIQVEDIRVEPGVREQYPRPTPARAGAPGRADAEAAIPASTETVRNVVQPAPPPVGSSAEHGEPVLPPIRLDAPATPRIASATLPPRPRDLLIPRSVVAAWSVLVLVAVGLAFTTGLLVGHYVWRVH